MTPRAWALAAGTAVIVIANGMALTGVAQNRSGEPESRVSLSQRELIHPWAHQQMGLGSDEENSGVSLTLDWRVPQFSLENYSDRGSRGGVPDWLDDQRMADLGFDVARIRGDDARRSHYLMQSEREVLVVLELAGSAWQQALEKARQRQAQQEAMLAANPTKKELIEAAERARTALQREESENSRLFAIDVGTELTTLRAKYPDRGRYLILKSTLRPTTTLINHKRVVTGYLGGLRVPQINVPHSLRGIFETPRSQVSGSTPKRPPFTAVVAIGKRLEPWMEAATAP